MIADMGVGETNEVAKKPVADSLICHLRSGDEAMNFSKKTKAKNKTGVKALVYIEKIEKWTGMV